MTRKEMMEAFDEALTEFAVAKARREGLPEHVVKMIAQAETAMKGKRIPFDKAFIEKALDGIAEGSQSMLFGEEGDGEHPAVQFIFTGHADDEGKLVGIALPQGLGMTDDKAAIMEAIKKGIREAKGSILVVLVDEAYAFVSKDPRDEVAEKIKNGELKLEQMAKEGNSNVKEALIFNVIGLDFQYLQVNDIDRVNKKLNRGPIISAHGSGEFEGRMVAWGTKKDLN